MMSMPIQSSSHAASGDHLSADSSDVALPGLLTMTIDRDALAHNAQVVARNAQLANPDHPAELMAVVKANGYNHGAVEAARVFLANGATQLGVATITEAVELRRAGISAPILAWIWNADDHVSVKAALDYGIDLGVPTLAHIRAIVDEATKRKRFQEDWEFVPPRVTVMVDSGLSRSGISPDQWDDALKELSAASSDSIIDVTGAFTHLASADAADNPSNNRQKAQFDAAIEELQAAGIPVRINHMCNSPASVTRPDMFYQMVRPGVALYGMDPLEEPADRTSSTGFSLTSQLKPAMTLSAPIVAKRLVKAGESVSYGGTWTADVDTVTGVVPAGYADGIPRALSGRMEVAINGRRYPQIGRVCMDQIVVALGPAGSEQASAVHQGDEAIVFGPPGECIGSNGKPASLPTATELAETLGTIHYEILTSPHTRVHRRYVGRGLVDGRVRVRNAEATQTLAESIAHALRPGDVVVLDGPLGAGKTTFTQGLARGLHVSGRVTSPTFTIAREHPGPVPLIHVDAYRLLGDTTTDPIGALDSLDLDTRIPDSIVVAEWAADMADALEQDYLLIRLERATGGSEKSDGNDASAGGDPSTSADPVDFDEDEPRVISWTWVRR